MTDQQRQSQSNLVGHGRVSMGLGAADPRARRAAAAVQRAGIVSPTSSLTQDGTGKLAIDEAKLDVALQKRGFRKDGA